MKSQVFAVFDQAAAAYMQPFFMIARGQAVRVFSDMARDVATNIGRHPEDFTLFYLGEFDDEKGQFVVPSTPVSLGKASEFLARQAAEVDGARVRPETEPRAIGRSLAHGMRGGVSEPPSGA